jgi:DNA-binding transcriptional ArsR family regulator
MPPLHHEIFHKALSSDIRRGILISLSKKEKYLSEISNEINKKPQTVDFHLNILEEIGLIDDEWKEGRKYYFLRDKKILDFIREDRPIPVHLRHKPPHEIVIDSMKELTKRMDRIEKKLDSLMKK